MTRSVVPAALAVAALSLLAACDNAQNETSQTVISERVAATPKVAGPVIPTENVAAKRGERAFLQCASCHAMSTSEDGRNDAKIGPSLLGVYGRDAGALDGYPYSDALANSALIWDKASLDAFIEDPSALIAGTKMVYAGSNNPEERADIIAYLEAAGESAGE